MSAKHAFFLSQVSQIETVYKRPEAEEIAYCLIDAYLGKSRLEFWDIASGDLDFESDSMQEQFKQAIERLLVDNEPVQYIVGHTYFLDSKLKVTPAVLIPRQETEELVSMIIQNEKENYDLKVLDIGTGSGCIPISLSKTLKCKQVIGADISNEALAIATENAQSNKTKITFVELDILNQQIPFQELDIIVSNPPYVLESDKKQMHNNVLDHEPELALFVPDNNPLLFYEAICKKSLEVLISGGRLYLEIHEDYGRQVQKLLIGLGFIKVQIHQDLFLSKDRMVVAKKG